MSANAQTTANTAVATTPSAQQANDFAQTRRVLAKSNLCDWYRTGGA